jgi:hypothetical protein
VRTWIDVDNVDVIVDVPTSSVAYVADEYQQPGEVLPAFRSLASQYHASVSTKPCALCSPIACDRSPCTRSIFHHV